jgi:tRNA pseudouridine38-40 synthase
MTLFEPELPGAPVPTVRARLELAYDGTGFHGFAENVGVRTVGGVLREALERTLGHQVSLTVAGRTDRGVHARAQIVSFDARADRFEPESLTRSLNKVLGPALAVRHLGVAAADFDARFSATGRSYRYRILNTPVRDPLIARTTWHVAAPLDLDVLRLGADALIGEHDFSSFCRRPPAQPDGTEPSRVRRVRTARWHPRGDGMLEFEISASSFCHQMVRSVVGTLVDMGLGRRKPGEMLAILDARDRNAAGQVAPPHGLILWDVSY